MRFLPVLLLVSFLATYAGASYVSMVQPYNATLQNGGSTFLGKVGPGQSFYIIVSSSTAYANGTNVTYGWNKLVVNGAPAGWIVQNSSLNAQQLAVKIRASPTAQNGQYTFNVTAVNTGNYSKLGNATFKATVNVTPNVFQLSVSPTNVSTGPGEPATIYVTINNTGVSDSPFNISASGLPGFAQNQTKTIIALHHTTQVAKYQIYENTPGSYNFKVNVVSSSSPLIFKNSNVTLTIAASIPNDYLAIGQGALLFPPIYEPVYAVMQIISLLFKH